MHSQINIQKLYIKKEQDKEKHFWRKYPRWDVFNNFNYFICLLPNFFL